MLGSTWFAAHVVAIARHALHVEQVVAEKRAEELAGKFKKHAYEENAPYPYWWGRNDDERESHRYVIKPFGVSA